MRKCLWIALALALALVFAGTAFAQRGGSSGPVVTPSRAGYSFGGGKLVGKGFGKTAKRKELCTVLEVRDDGSIRVFNENRDREHDFWIDEETTVLRARRKKDFGKKTLEFEDLAEGQKLEVISKWRSDEALEVKVLSTGS